MDYKELDRHICSCPYFDGKNTVDRSKYGTHIGSCALEGHYEKICPSERCICAKSMGLKEKRKTPKLINAGELMRVIPPEEINARTAVYYSPAVEAITIEWIASWMGKHQGLKYDGWNLAVGTMIADWREENERFDR